MKAYVLIQWVFDARMRRDARRRHGRSISASANSPWTAHARCSLAVVRSIWAILPLVLALLWASESRGAIHLGDLVISNIGHTFQPGANGSTGVVIDWLIDPEQLFDANERLSVLTTNFTTEDTFTLRISASAGKKFWFHPPRDTYVRLHGAVNWQLNLTPGSASGQSGILDVSFDNLVGTMAAPSSSSFYTPALSRLGFGFSASAFTEFTFTSITLTLRLPEGLIRAGAGPVTFLPDYESLVVDTYSLADSGSLISLVPIEQPINAMVSLSQALDTENAPFDWSTIGDSLLPWNGRLFGSRDGTDVAESGSVADGTAATLQGKVVGPGTLNWWWKVSSQTNKDHLKIFVDSVQQARISGEVDWQERSLHLAGGLHVLKWTYSKDASGAGGADKGWVDQVRLTPDTNCMFNLIATGRAIDAGSSTGTLEVVTGPDCLWSVICTNSWIVTITPTLNRGSGLVQYVVRSNPGSAPRAGVLSIAGQPFVVTQPGGPRFETVPSLEEALDLQRDSYISYQSMGLLGQPSVTHDGEDAVQFGPVGDSATVSMHVRFRGPGTLSFWWKVSCETNLDMLKFFGPEGEVRISGETDWQYRSYHIAPAGYDYEVYWIYSKDESVSAGNDRGWLDQLLIVPDIQGSVAISPSNRVHGFGDETGFIDVTLKSGSWRAWTTSQWIYVYAATNVTSTTGGRVNYRVYANVTGQERIGQIHIEDQTFTVRQTPLSLNLRLVGYTRTNGALLQIQGPRLQTNIIQASSNLVHWTPISTNQMPDTDCPTCPNVQIMDPTATNLMRRFYRAVQK